ncbi:recombinase family protein [Microbacterium sp. NPDC055910]|uniref:recombinase family protein n=1 Tax=Microbacterium sp. NPDC055910 TaxID=3345659 RepID=UPI0035DBD014
MGTKPRRSAALLDGPDSCVIYVRISQARDGSTTKVETQERECRALAKRLGLAVEKVYRDNDMSATSGKVRPAFEAMLKARPEAIIAWHQDRLLRLTSDLEKVIDLGVGVHFVVSSTLELSTPAGRAVGRTVAAWSQYEGEQKAERQRAANVARAERGHWQFSRRPYGYERRDGRVEIVEAEAEIVRELYRRYIAGESLYAIAADLTERDVPTFDGAWSMKRVGQILRNDHYAGIVTYQGDRVDAPPSWVPLIDERTWSDYVETRVGRRRKGAWSTTTRHLLSGMLTCGVCGSRMLARPDRGHQVYACTTNWCVSMRGADVEPVVEGIVLARLADKKVLHALRHVPDTAPLQAEIAALRKRREDVTDLLAEGILDRRKARQQAADLSARIDALAGRLAAMRKESPLTDLALARSIPTRWKGLSVLNKRRVIEDLGLQVTVNKSRPGRRPLDAEGKPIVDLRRLQFDWLDANAEAIG